MESSYIATLQLPGLRKQARQIHVLPKMKTSLLISLEVVCDYGYIITPEQQDMSVQNNET